MTNATPIVVTAKQMEDFITAQPPERKIAFDESNPYDACGCLMVHYGKAHGFEFDGCGFETWGLYVREGIGMLPSRKVVAEFEGNLKFSSFLPLDYSCILDVKNYGQLQQAIRDKESKRNDQ